MDVSTLPVFGSCDRCGNGGIDVSTGLSTRVELISFEGKNLCQICLIELQDHRVDSIKNKHEKVEEKFRNGIGIRKI